MRFIVSTVGLLAVLCFSGCGVGVDDLEGQQAAASAQQEQALVGLEGKPAGNGTEQAPAGNGPFDPSIAALPTDPVPWQQPATDDPRAPGVDNPFANLVRPPPGMPSTK